MQRIQELTLGEKLKIIDEIEESHVHNFADIGRKHGVSRSSISKLWKNRESIKREGEETENRERKRKRPFQR